MSSSPRALILGIRSGIARAITLGLLAQGWRISALVRQTSPQDIQHPKLHYQRGDAMDSAAVLHAAQHCELIFHGLNPPHYRHWDKLVLPMLDNTIQAARRQQALIVLPGNLYNYGPYSFSNAKEDALQQALTRKGQVRVSMERRLEAASNQGIASLIVRTGDYFGPATPSSWFTQALSRTQGSRCTLYHLGPQGVGHAWAYVPDVAHTMLALIQQRHRLPTFARFHMRGHWDPDNRLMSQMLAQHATALGYQIQYKNFPWPWIRLAAPFVPRFKELLDMRYLWQHSISLDNRLLLQTLGQEIHTPWPEAIAHSISSLGWKQQ